MTSKKIVDLDSENTSEVEVFDLYGVANVWGTDKALINADEFCPDCEHMVPGHYTNCPTRNHVYEAEREESRYARESLTETERAYDQ